MNVLCKQLQFHFFREVIIPSGKATLRSQDMSSKHPKESVVLKKENAELGIIHLIPKQSF